MTKLPPPPPPPGKSRNGGLAEVVAFPRRAEPKSEAAAADSDEVNDALVDTIAAAARGDRRSWEALYRRYYPEVYRHVAFMLHDAVQAEDLTQEIFALAMLRLDKLDQLSAFPGWLHGIARHLVYKHWRSSGRRQRHQLRYSDERVDDVAVDDIEARHIDQRRAQALREVLETLPDHLREAYVAVDIRQLAADKAAAQLGITRGNLAVRASRARTRIRQELCRLGWIEERRQ